MIVSYWILADIEYIERIWKTRLACNNHPCSKCNSTKCFHQPDHPNSWEILWMGGCQVIHMSSFWNLQRHQSAGQRLQPGISTRLTSFLGWVKMSDPETKKTWSSVFLKKLVMKHPYFFCVPNFHPSPSSHRKNGIVSWAPDTPPLRQGSQSPLVKMMRLLFSTADLRYFRPTWEKWKDVRQ